MFDRVLNLGLWMNEHPEQYAPIGLALGAMSYAVGAQFGSWDAVGVLKFFMASTLFATTVGTPLLYIAANVLQRIEK